MIVSVINWGLAGACTSGYWALLSCFVFCFLAMISSCSLFIVNDNRINVYHPKYIRANDSIITRSGVINPRYIMFQIRFAGDDYIEKRGAKCVMIEALASKLKTHIKAIEEFAKKYNLEKSPTGIRYILWWNIVYFKSKKRSLINW